MGNDSIADLMELVFSRGMMWVLEEEYREKEEKMSYKRILKVLKLLAEDASHYAAIKEVAELLGEEPHYYSADEMIEIQKLKNDVAGLQKENNDLAAENNKLAAGCCERVETNAYGNKTCSILSEINSLKGTLAAAQRIRDLKCKESDNLAKENVELKRVIADKDDTVRRLRKQLPPINTGDEYELLRSELRIKELKDALGICIASMEKHDREKDPTILRYFISEIEVAKKALEGR